MKRQGGVVTKKEVLILIVQSGWQKLKEDEIQPAGE